MEAIQRISDEAKRVLGEQMPRDDLLSALSVSLSITVNKKMLTHTCGNQALIDENHSHLVTLGVSHPSLEAIKAKTTSSPYALHTKLTGAGGGGCAVTLLPDGE